MRRAHRGKLHDGSGSRIPSIRFARKGVLTIPAAPLPKTPSNRLDRRRAAATVGKLYRHREHVVIANRQNCSYLSGGCVTSTRPALLTFFRSLPTDAYTCGIARRLGGRVASPRGLAGAYPVEVQCQVILIANGGKAANSAPSVSSKGCVYWLEPEAQLHSRLLLTDTSVKPQPRIRYQYHFRIGRCVPHQPRLVVLGQRQCVELLRITKISKYSGTKYRPSRDRRKNSNDLANNHRLSQDLFRTIRPPKAEDDEIGARAGSTKIPSTRCAMTSRRLFRTENH